jgi:DNA helicase-2/ATP-dependent DNA helicase PcrA
MERDRQAWLSDLNPEQRTAVTHGDGPLLVVAGAGSGKTKTLAYRVAHLVASGVAPERILLLTFTRRAAQEMLRRAAAAVGAAEPGGESLAARVWGGTFHAIANRLLRMYAPAAGLSPEFTIMDRADAEDLLDVIRTEMGLGQTGSRFPRKATCLAIYSRRVNGARELDAVLEKDFPWCAMWRRELGALFRAYVDRKQGRQVLDYDDLLLYLFHLLEDAAVAAAIGDLFDHVLVDEYQDTNRLQAAILAGLRRANTNLTVAGDDAQSIYGFRAATVRNMLDFPAEFPATRIVTLAQNYRSVPPILETANRVIAQATERHSKELWSARRGGERPVLVTCHDESHQDDAVIRQVLARYEEGVPLRRQAVLFRAVSHSSSLEVALARRNIPFRKYGGLRFLEAAHVKDVMAILRIADNPRDEMAWFRVLQLLPGIGPATAAAAFAHVASRGFAVGALESFAAPPAAAAGVARLAALLEELVAREGEAVAVQMERVRRFYEPLLLERYEEGEARLADIEHLGRLASGHDSRRQLLADLVLDPPLSTGDRAGPPHKDEDWLVLSTIHSAKGLEWDAVYLIHAADGFLPSDMAAGGREEIEEELRLTYVALTRARDFLSVFWPQRYYVGSGGLADRHTYAQCCRFFSPEVVRTMDTAIAGPGPGPDRPPARVGGGRDIAGRIRDMWG